jgi:hypothetical protein
VPPVRYPTVQVVAVVEFCFGVQMVLSQRLVVALHLVPGYWLARLAT